MLTIKTNFHPVAGETENYFKKKKENTKSCFQNIGLKAMHFALLSAFPTSNSLQVGGGGRTLGVLETNKNKFWFEPKQTETRSVSRLFRFVS
jgi:hypothetical protein